MIYPEDEAYFLVKQAVSLRGTLSSAAIAAARMRRLGKLGMQGAQLMHLTPQVYLEAPNARPTLPLGGPAAAYAPVGNPVETY